MYVMDKNWLVAKPKKEVTIEDEKTPQGIYMGGEVVKNVGESVFNSKNPTKGYNYTPYAGGFKPSKAYTDAMAYTNSVLERLSSGKTNYSDKLDAIMGKIENRPEFSYDFNTDPLFQNALASAMSAGQTAMQDTIGQASALTGGYGSSYATSAANQAYNNMVKGAYDNLPQYYGLARDAYDREGDALYNQLGMYRAADESEYSRLNNAYNLNLNAANTMYDRENSEYWNRANYNRQVAESNANIAYKYAALAQDKAYSDAKLKEEQRQFNETNKTKTTKVTELPSDVQKALINSIQTNGTGANSKLWEYTDILEAQGYSTDQIDAIIAAYDPTPEYSINAYGQYVDQFKNRIEDTSDNGRGGYKTANLNLVSGKKGKKGSVYVDEYDNTYTYEDLEKMGLLKLIK